MQNRCCLYETLHNSVGEREAGRAIVAEREDAWRLDNGLIADDATEWVSRAAGDRPRCFMGSRTKEGTER
jgi:hypothetical protein